MSVACVLELGGPDRRWRRIAAVAERNDFYDEAFRDEDRRLLLVRWSSRKRLPTSPLEAMLKQGPFQWIIVVGAVPSADPPKEPERLEFLSEQDFRAFASAQNLPTRR